MPQAGVSDLLDSHVVVCEELTHVVGVGGEDGCLGSLYGFPPGHGRQDGVDGVLVSGQAGGLQHPACHEDHLLTLDRAPEQLQRHFYEVTQLTITLHENSDDVRLSIRLPAEQQSEITHAAEILPMPQPAEQPVTSKITSRCVGAVGAPGGAADRWERA